MEQEYYRQLASAYLRGHARQNGWEEALPRFLREELPCESTPEEWQQIRQLFAEKQLKLHAFKKIDPVLLRVKKVLGFLQGVQPGSLLDVGSGRGAFLFPFLDRFPWVETTSIDLLDHRIDFLQTLSAGGLQNLKAVQADLCSQPFPEQSFDVVTLLEVLEHIPDVQAAVSAAVRMGRKYIVVTVPSKEDNNPEHIHLLTKEVLTGLFEKAGCTRLHFDGVPGHLFLTVTL